jgi:hypothetical protein
MLFLACLLALLLALALAFLERERRKRLLLESALGEGKACLEAADKEKAALELQKDGLAKNLASLKEQNVSLERRIEDLKTALNANSFDGRFPICSNCKDIRDEKGCWHSIEEFIAGLSEADFSHSLCPDCARKLYPDMFEDGKKLHTLTWK